MADRRVGKRPMGRRGRPKIESGTCNVCSAPCSSCMHRNAGFTGSKSEESSDENSHGVVASQCSFNADDLLRSSGVNSLGSSQKTASSLVNSNHDTSSGNAESKAIIRSSDICNGPMLHWSRKDQDSMKVNSCNNYQARNILGRGKVKEKSGAENNEDKKTISTESSPHSGHSGMVGKSRENVLLNKADELNTSAMSENESADSEMLELDVKVCDICGDAGREDLLAICSRCSDGAEHTYCMRVMLKRVPEGDWLCEECKFAEEAEKQKIDTKGKRETEVTSITHNFSKKHIEKFEAAPESKRQAVEAPTGSPKRSILPRLSALSRETSFKGLEKPTRKLAHHSSFKSHSSDETESTRSTDSQLQSPKGSYFKSNSFNSSSSRPKVRPVDDVILPRKKTGRENTSIDMKEGFSGNVGKLMSSRCIDVGSSSCNDSKVKGSKQLKDQANPSASTVDQKLISRGNSSISYANSSRDLKGLQSDGTQGSLTKQARHLSRNRLEDIVASVGDTSTNEKCSSSEQISSEAKCKDVSTNVDGLPRSREFREVGENNKDTVGNHQSRNIREDVNKGNRLRAAVDAALRKKPSFGKNRGLEQSDLPSMSNVDSGCDKALKFLPSKVPVIRDWPVGMQGGHRNLRTDKHTIPVNGKQLTLGGADAIAASELVEPGVHFPSVKPVMRDLPVASPTVLLSTSAIPEHEYIWQGDLEVQKSRNLSSMHSGMQAHLSTLVSPKVVEVVNRFPEKVTLNEVPRLSTWPAQFQDVGAKEHHVALFFFAKDIESYEKNYKPLVDNMIQKDLALKGNLEGAELLIFASNQLPQNCQRWNMLFFLWGVFRGKKENCTNPLKNTPLPASCVLPNMGKAFCIREAFRHENTIYRESLTDHRPSRVQSCMKEENGIASGAIEKEKAFSVSFGDTEAVEETEEGEIGVIPQLKDKASVSSTDMNLNKEELCEGPVKKKLKTVTGVETKSGIFRRDTPGNESASRNSGAGPCEEEKIMEKNHDERIVFPLDLNDGKEDDDKMVDNTRRPLGNDKKKRRSLCLVPNYKLGLGEEKSPPTVTRTTGVVLPLMGGTASIKEHRSSRSHKAEDEMVKQEDDKASL